MGKTKDFGDIIAKEFKAGKVTFEFDLTDGKTIRVKILDAGPDAVKVDHAGKVKMLNPDNIVGYTLL